MPTPRHSAYKGPAALDLSFVYVDVFCLVVAVTAFLSAFQVQIV